MNFWDSIKADIAKTLKVDALTAAQVFDYIEDNYMVPYWSEATNAQLRRTYREAYEEMALA